MGRFALWQTEKKKIAADKPKIDACTETTVRILLLAIICRSKGIATELVRFKQLKLR